MAPRSSPQLRLFRNDFAAGNALVRAAAVGHEEQSRRHRRARDGRDRSGLRSRASSRPDPDSSPSTRRAAVRPGQEHARDQRRHRLAIGAGSVPARDRSQSADRGDREAAIRCALSRSWRQRPRPEVRSPARRDIGRRGDGATWLYQRYPAPDFTLRDVSGQEQSLAAHAGHPSALLFWATWAPPSRALLDELGRQQRAIAAAGAQALALSVDGQDKAADVQAASKAVGLPIAIAGTDVAGTYSLLHRYLFDRREDLRLPTLFLVNGRGEIVKVYHEPAAAVANIAGDIGKIEVPEPERLARPCRSPGTFYAAPGERNYFQYGLELSEQGYDAAALVAFEHVAKVDPSAITFYNLGTLYMRRGRSADAQAAFERALQLQNRLRGCQQQPGCAARTKRRGARRDRAVPRGARRQAPVRRRDEQSRLRAVPDRRRGRSARELYEKALTLQPEFPEALNNLGIFYGSQRDLGSRPDVLSAGGETAPRVWRSREQSRPGSRGAGRDRQGHRRAPAAPSGQSRIRNGLCDALSDLFQERPAAGRHAGVGTPAPAQSDTPDRPPTAPGDPRRRMIRT